jgi:hypothetical protein
LALDPGDWLDDEDRAALHQALKDSDEDIKAGRLVDADVILRELLGTSCETGSSVVSRVREQYPSRDPG